MVRGCLFNLRTVCRVRIESAYKVEKFDQFPRPTWKEVLLPFNAKPGHDAKFLMTG